MDKITLIVNIVRSSILFDNEFQKGNYLNLRDHNDMIKSYIKNLNTYSSNSNDDKILELCTSLYDLNFRILELTQGTYKSKEKLKLNKDKNTIILFYKPDCIASINFIPDWNKLKAVHNNKYNMVAINCSNPKYEDVCNFFKIYEYPTIKLIKPQQINDYFGKMDATSITNDLIDSNS